MSIINLLNVGIAPDELNNSIVSMWTRESIRPVDFYRTGFEVIFYNHDRQHALNCVLSSVIPEGKEILITGEDELKNVAEKADQFGIQSIIFQAEIDEIHLIDALLNSHKGISHLILVVEQDDGKIENYVRNISPFLKHRGIGLILYCLVPVQRVNDRTNGMVDFMIGGWENIPDKSFIVARRSKLVQTEGNGRALTCDLYASWQWSLKSRGTHIEPVEM